MSKLRASIAAAMILSSAGAAPVLAQSTHEPFLRRDTPPTAWYYDNRDDTRDFQANGVFPGDFAARPGLAWLGAAGIIGSTLSGGSHFGPIYCTRRYRSHNPMPGYFQGDDGVWYRCRG
ncbi:BA14K family protein [Bradyrhizobium canariense]|uniref:Lectin-like protein BA14k n=1 Tax=Bradyrhizobium canariense TaxID=255045 RepID=A0A1H2BPA4_9BRAD|nr:BA14K family protein [Bradyrhizobium canariense]SDT60071.1 hypothetical protein SAMN05444158_7401 [Bradyrhizobium canariense]